MSQLAPANPPSPPSTFQITAPAIKPGIGLGDIWPSPSVENRSASSPSPKLIVPLSVKVSLPITVTPDSKYAIPPSAGWNTLSTPPGPIIVCSEQLVALVVALRTPGSEPGTAPPLN